MIEIEHIQDTTIKSLYSVKHIVEELLNSLSNDKDTTTNLSKLL